MTIAEEIKCPKCEELGRDSVVVEGLTESTLIAWSPHWAKGKVHHHDPNTYTTEYTCCCGHQWSKIYKKPCPACGFTYGEEIPE